MADFTHGRLPEGSALTEQLDPANQLLEPGWGATALSGTAQFLEYRAGFEEFLALQDPDLAAGFLRGPYSDIPEKEFAEQALLDQELTVGSNWWEFFHVVPRRFDFGNILTPQAREISVFSAHREQSRDWEEFASTVGAGVNVPDLPSLPLTFAPLSGVELTLEVLVDGPPVIDGDLIFTFEQQVVAVPVTGQRIVLFPFRPETPVRERLEFLTDIFEHIDGSEQRVALRDYPRQVFDLRFALNGVERARVENLLFDWQGRLFGLPVWHEPAFLTTSASAGQFSVQVHDTTLGDFREGGLVILIRDSRTFDALEAVEVTPTSISFNTPLIRDYPRGSQVLPLRTAFAGSRLSGSRAPVNDAEVRITFRVTDNVVDLADASDWPTLAGATLLDGANLIERRLAESLSRRLYSFDNLTGAFSQLSPWDRSKRGLAKGFKTGSREELWELRKLLHALRGRVVSFWLPTFYDELVPVEPLLEATSTLTVKNVGYSRFVQNRPPRQRIRVVPREGEPIHRVVVSSGEVDEETEQLIVDTPWAATIPAVEVLRIEYVERVRFDTDSIEIEHVNALGEARCVIPVKVVLGE